MNSKKAAKPLSTNPWNVPNAITLLRLILSIAIFVLMPFKYYLASLIVFVIAASTDWIDGWWARKYGQVTKIGRVFDPFVDKIIICGTFIYLAAESHTGSGVEAWMAVVVMGRELLVTVIRSMVEQSGGDFSAGMAGKLKMVVQCVAAGASLFTLHYLDMRPEGHALPEWLHWTLVVSVWSAMLLTIYSGVEYIFAAAKYFK